MDTTEKALKEISAEISHLKEATEKALKEISAEISHLKEQRQATQKEAERAGERLKEVSDRRSAFAPDTLLHERGVAEELVTMMGGLVEALDEESEVLSRTKARAEDAALELDRLIMKAEVRYHQAKKQLAQRRYEALCKERYAYDEDAEEIIGVLVNVLDQLEGLYTEQVRAATDAENPSPSDPRTMIENWLLRRLDRWLSLESLEKYDTPLPELDPLALKPEPSGGSLGARDVGSSADSERPRVSSAVSSGVHSQSRDT
jgi:hypothetical protein